MAVALSKKISSCEVSLTPVNNQRLMSLCGKLDEHLRQIERHLGVEIHNRGSVFQIFGEKEAVHATHELLNKLYIQTENGAELTPEKIHLFLQNSLQKNILSQPFSKDANNELFINARKEKVRAHSANQQAYINHILNNDIIFGIGPAGTGKTYLAVACAISALEAEKVRRILLVRPAVEAGERLGFLPGDLSQKIDPYLRPLYDALHEMLGAERVNKLIERNIIELAPLAYMRGRTLNDAFIILDESQNTTKEQMKMFLTRLGFGSKAVITGDVTQIDLPNGTASGLKHAMQVLKDIPKMHFAFFDSRDVVRHPIVQKIVEAYDRFENKEK